MVTGHRPQRLRGQEKEVSAAVGELLDQLKPDKANNAAMQGIYKAVWREEPLKRYKKVKVK